jgi:hypothetical protein
LADLDLLLRLSEFAKKLDDGKYAYSWYENAEEAPALKKRLSTATRAGRASRLTCRRRPKQCAPLTSGR